MLIHCIASALSADRNNFSTWHDNTRLLSLSAGPSTHAPVHILHAASPLFVVLSPVQLGQWLPVLDMTAFLAVSWRLDIWQVETLACIWCHDFPLCAEFLGMAAQTLSTLKHQMRMLDGRIWDFSPEKPYHDISDFWDGEVPESNLE